MTVEGCFIRTMDDCLAFKGMDGGRSNCENITVRDTMMWTDQCCTILLGDESRAAYMRNITIRDCFVPYLSYEGYPKKFLMLHAGEEMKLLATDLEVGLRCRCAASVAKGGSVTIPAKKLYEIARVLRGESADV